MAGGAGGGRRTADGRVDGGQVDGGRTDGGETDGGRVARRMILVTGAGLKAMDTSPDVGVLDTFHSASR